MTEEYGAGPPAIPEMLAVVDAARALLRTSPNDTTNHRELAAALDAFDRTRAEGDVETSPGTPSARAIARSRSTTDGATSRRRP